MIAVSVETLARDIFPAEIACPDGRVIRDARAFATTHRLIAYAVSDGQITTVLNVDLAEPGSVTAGRLVTGPVRAVTTDGVYFVNRGRGCGCTGPSRVLKALGAPVTWTGE